MIPVWIRPWMIKGGAIVLLFSAVFYGGCRTGKNMSQNKIQRLESNYDRCVGIVDTFQLNVDTLEQAIEDNNAAVIKLGEDHNAKVISMQASHDASIRRLNAANADAIRTAEEEAAEIRENMVILSVAESCVYAMQEIAQ